jgi:hypothetical protein
LADGKRSPISGGTSPGEPRAAASRPTLWAIGTLSKTSMFIPSLSGLIDRRMLVNFNADPLVISKLIPAPFRPQLYKGRAIVGICLIRLKNVRPKGVPSFLGMSSENGAHRFAVEWDDNGVPKTGVYIPRRDTSSYINALAGNRFFPGKHFHAEFKTSESDLEYSIQFESSDSTKVKVEASVTDSWNSNSVFESVQKASEFFKGGSVGYSPNGSGFDGIELKTTSWNVRPLKLKSVYSSFFLDSKIFPEGTIVFDNVLLMQGIEHEWKGVSRLSHCP